MRILICLLLLSLCSCYEIHINNCDQPSVPIDTVSVITPPVNTNKIKFGVTYGASIDHHTTQVLPNYGRLFYYKEKDKPDGIPFYLYDFIPLFNLQMPVGISWDSTMAENAFRVEKASKLFTTLSVSLEEVVSLIGTFHKFPFKDTPYDEYGRTDAEVDEVVYSYITKWLITNGTRVEILELGNEPWGYTRAQWKVIEAASIRAYVDYDGPKPLLASAAVPVGQGNTNTKDNITSFFNFSLIKEYDILTAHFYPIQNGQFLTSRSEIMESMKMQIKCLMEFHAEYAPHTDIYLTETGVPVGDDLWFYQWLFEYCSQFDAIKVIYAYNYNPIPTPPFENLYMVDTSYQHTDTYNYLLNNFN